ncbi:MAG: c-type cytochrome, partial [Chloroflexota bacterium]
MTFFLRQLYIFANRFTRVSLLAAVLSLALVACGDLAGQPEIVAELPTDAPMGADNQQDEGVPDIPDPLPLELPPAMPDVANGAAIFAQNCTSCHGENG